MKTRIKKWGNSSAVRIPAPMLRRVHLSIDESVDVRAEPGRIVIEPLRKKTYDISEMVRQITPKNRHATVDAVPAVSNEVW